MRTPLNPNSLWTALKHLTRWFNYLTGAGVASVAKVTQAHCDAYLESISGCANEPGRRLSPATLTISVCATQILTLYEEILSDSYRPGFIPWAGHRVDDVVGYMRTDGNSVPPVPDALMRPLLANALYLVQNIAPLLAAEATAARAADQLEAGSRPAPCQARARPAARSNPGAECSRHSGPPAVGEQPDPAAGMRVEPVRPTSAHGLAPGRRACRRCDGPSA
jgi:hypothetical protein